jgi:4a-hydroxytetrahydrobiopterin dehydratase
MSNSLRGSAISGTVTPLGWRYVLGGLQTAVAVTSLARAAEVATRIATAGGGDLRVDLRRDGVLLCLPGPDVAAARRISSVVTDLGLRTAPGTHRSVQAIEIAIDALDIPSIRPFWQAVTGYVQEGADLVDPLGQSPPIWFQQLDQPRPQRNRVHLDISVAHDEAPRRIERATAAGGVLRSDSSAPAFWVLADAEGNEACVSTWQGRD